MVDKLQTLYPGGAWRQGWARNPAVGLSDKRDAAERFTKPLPPKFGGVGGAPGKPRRVPGKLGECPRGAFFRAERYSCLRAVAVDD